MEQPYYLGSYYQPLFDLMNQHHSLLLTETEMADVIEVVRNMDAATAQPPSAPSGEEDEMRWLKQWSGNKNCSYNGSS